jgi:ABC-type transporter MlaC component
VGRARVHWLGEHGTTRTRTKTMTRPITTLLIASLITFGLTRSALAGPAQDAVKRMQLAAEKDDVATLDRHVDYAAIAQASLGSHWAELSASEQTEFVGNFQTIVRRAYQKGLSGKQKHELRFVGESESPEGPVVHTRVKVKASEPELAIDYLMSCAEDACRLIDVVTDGSSLVDSWRRMFRRIIKQHGKAELLARIAKKAKTES